MHYKVPDTCRGDHLIEGGLEIFMELWSNVIKVVLPEDVDDSKNSVSVRCLRTVQGAGTNLGPWISTILVDHSVVVW